jgi:diguanylate cyclase (GGDEF)-like protein
MSAYSSSSDAVQRLAGSRGGQPVGAPSYSGGAGSALDFLAGESAMAAEMRAFDWAVSSLGRPDTWPRALRGAVRTMLNTRHPVLIFWGGDATLLYNDGFRAAIGRQHPLFIGLPGREIAADMWDILGPQIEQVMAGGPPTWHENQLIPVTVDGLRDDIYWTYSYGPIDDPEVPGGIGGVLGLCSVTTAMVLAERRIAADAQRQRELFQQAPGFMAMLHGAEHRFEFANAPFVRLVGGRDVVGRTAAEALPETVEQGFIDLLDGVFRSGQAFTATGAKFAMQAEAEGPAVDHYLDFIYQPVTDADGRVTGICVQGADVTELTLAMNALHVLARVDQLTELPNRAAMIEVIERRIARQKRDAGSFSLLYLDLDGFKRLNDRHGHAAGDAALREVASILKQSLRKDDVAGRLGGDEFLVAVAGDEARAAATAERLRCELEARMRAGGSGVTASIGVATFPLPPESADAALAAADALMYAAKMAGGDRLETGLTQDLFTHFCT